MNSVNKESKTINKLVQRLSELKTQRETIIQEENKILTELLLLSSVKKVQSSIDKKTDTNYTKHTQDRQDIPIDIGDTVEFLSPTKFEGNLGIVHSFSQFRVTALNKEGRKVSKASHNLAVRKKTISSNINDEVSRIKK